MAVHLCPCGQSAVPQLMGTKERPCYGLFAPDDVVQALPDMPRVLSDIVSGYAVGCSITRLKACSQCRRLAAIVGATRDSATLSKNRSCEMCRQEWRDKNRTAKPSNYSYDLYTEDRYGIPSRFPRANLNQLLLE